MADLDGILENKDKDYGIGIPVANQHFILKGSDNLDWGMKDRLARIFNVKSGRTVISTTVISWVPPPDWSVSTSVSCPL